MGTTLLYGKGVNPQRGMSANAAGLARYAEIVAVDSMLGSYRRNGSVNGLTVQKWCPASAQKVNEMATPKLRWRRVYDVDHGRNKP
jgi:hypothetical protein